MYFAWLGHDLVPPRLDCISGIRHDDAGCVIYEEVIEQ